MAVRRVLLVAFLVGLVCADQAPAQDLTIATFNAEFLTRPKVHIKFGLPFNMGKATDAQRAEWNQLGFRDQKFNEAAQAVAQVIANIDADVVALTEVVAMDKQTNIWRALNRPYGEAEAIEA